MAIRMQLAPRVICTICTWCLYIYEKDGQLLARHGGTPELCPDAGKDFLIPTTDLEQYHNIVAEVPQDLPEHLEPIAPPVPPAPAAPPVDPTT